MTGTNSRNSARSSEAVFPKPVLSICVTTYNRAAWLEHSLPTILEQTRPYSDLVEVVVCDNASTDQTPSVAARFASWPNFRVHRNARNVGMLGNLAVSANQARGRYVWVIGDDDLMVDGALDRVLAAIATHPDVELIYTNYAYTRFDRPQELRRANDVIHGAIPVSDEVRDEHVERSSALCAKSDNCFTSIYCLIFRDDHARAAYGQDTSGQPFSSLPTCVPSTHYVIERLFDRPGYWVGDPCVVVNLNVSWGRYAALYVLERFPEIFDRMEAAGATRADVDTLRAHHLPNMGHCFSELFFGAQREHLPAISIERLVHRFAHLPTFERDWQPLRTIYRRAFDAGRAGEGAPSPENLDALVAAIRSGRPTR